MKSKVNEPPQYSHTLTPKCYLCPAPPQNTSVRRNRKGPGAGNNRIWRSGDRVARSTSTKFRRHNTTSWG